MLYFLMLQKFKNIGFFDENIFFFFRRNRFSDENFKSGKKIYHKCSKLIFHEGGKSHDNKINHQKKCLEIGI